MLWQFLLLVLRSDDPGAVERLGVARCVGEVLVRDVGAACQTVVFCIAFEGIMICCYVPGKLTSPFRWMTRTSWGSHLSILYFSKEKFRNENMNMFTYEIHWSTDFKLAFWDERQRFQWVRDGDVNCLEAGVLDGSVRDEAEPEGAAGAGDDGREVGAADLEKIHESEDGWKVILTLWMSGEYPWSPSRIWTQFVTNLLQLIQDSSIYC